MSIYYSLLNFRHIFQDYNTLVRMQGIYIRYLLCSILNFWNIVWDYSTLVTLQGYIGYLSQHIKHLAYYILECISMLKNYLITTSTQFIQKFPKILQMRRVYYLQLLIDFNKSNKTNSRALELGQLFLYNHVLKIFVFFNIRILFRKRARNNYGLLCCHQYFQIY